MGFYPGMSARTAAGQEERLGETSDEKDSEKGGRQERHRPQGIGETGAHRSQEDRPDVGTVQTGPETGGSKEVRRAPTRQDVHGTPVRDENRSQEGRGPINGGTPGIQADAAERTVPDSGRRDGGPRNRGQGGQCRHRRAPLGRLRARRD